MVDILSHQAKETSFISADVASEHTDELPHINLKSVSIGKVLSEWPISSLGNGLTDGKTQYSQFPNMACNNSYGPVLSDNECASMEAAYPRCAQLIQSCYDNQYHPC